MNTKRVTIGRTLTHSPLREVQNEGVFSSVFVLNSGRKATFRLETIPSEEVAEKTFVRQETNGRDQSALTPESLRDITRTLKFQQFFPAIGVKDGDKIEILDGSRRRAAALICHTGLNVLVTDVSLSTEEARKLAKDIQTAKEHNIREVGLRLLALKNSGLNQKEIAALEGLSQAKVTRALQAASVAGDLISLFPVQSEITFTDYKLLSTIEETLKKNDVELKSLIESVSSEVDLVLSDDDLAEDEIKNRIIKIIAKESELLTSPASKDKASVTSIWSFSDKDRFARKRSKGRLFSYEFNRLPKEVQDELDRAIEDVLKKHLS
ncbi:ParB family protein [Franconibacter helveticus]|uniref:ParB family protein n=1 Tax=Franconibacter helveticus TaxID=357240 RepID=UPI0029073A3D|nr:ParB family protein [Franconibacter helveticus]MDU6926801.1 ParB family protein [Franconibacter helveticus]